MTETVSVTISGAAFSLLLFENIKSEFDQEGFLLGTVITKETNKLTDADHRVVHTQRMIKVKSAIPCPQQFYFYSGAGKIKENKITNLLSNQEDNVVGWYLFGRKRDAKLTLREKIVHKQLAKIFSSSDSYFTCCILTANNFDVKATYSLNQTFIRYHSCRYDSLPFHIINLSDSNYTEPAESASELLNKIVKSVKNSGESEGHLIVNKVQDSLQEHMKSLVKVVAEKEQELFKAEQEVKQLQYNHQLKREYAIGARHNDAINSEPDLFDTSLEGGDSQSSQDTSEVKKRRRGRQRSKVQTSPNSIVTRARASAANI